MASRFVPVWRWLAGAALGIALSAGVAEACACGCGVFDVGTAALFAGGAGGTVFFEYDFMNQHEDWHGTARAPKLANSDQKIRTSFMTLGGQYMFNRDWGVMGELPVWQRHFETIEGGALDSFDHAAMGDIRLMGIYSGFSADMSTGIIFGTKLPTGDSSYRGFDADTEIGTGSTDLLLGLYHQGALDKDANWIWFGQTMFDTPILHKPGYRPGAEIDAAIGSYYNSWYVGPQTQIAPMMQLILSHRAHDAGRAADPQNSGYDRLLISPGIEFDTGSFKVYGDVEFPLYQDTRGYQLVAPEQFKVIVSYAL